ncbi:hypothetical protein FA95DRAFT_1578653, partial [Auriscalpium vulgare]
TMKSNKEDAQCIADRVDQISALLEYTIPDATNISPPIKLAIEAFDQSLQRINEQLHEVCKASRVVRFIRVRKDEGRIKDIHQQLDDSIGTFTMSVSVQTKLQLDVVHADISLLAAYRLFYMPVRGYLECFRPAMVTPLSPLHASGIYDCIGRASLAAWKFKPH